MNKDHSLRAPVPFVLMLMIGVTVISYFVWMKQGLRLDEAQSIWQTSRDLPGVVRIIAKDVHVPFYFLALHFWELLFGTGEKAVRALSLAAFVAAIPVMYILARRAYSVRVAYYTALLTAVSPFLNWYGSEARMYSLLFLLTALSHLCFISLWKSPSGGMWAAYSIVTLVGAATHPFFGFIMLSQAIFFVPWRGLFPPRSLYRFGFLAAVVAALAAAWGVYRHLAGAGLSNFFIGFQTDGINTFFLSLWPVLVFVAFTLLDKKHQSEPETAYFMLCSFVPIALAFLVSVTVTPLFLSRYLIVALPSLYLLSVHFLSSYKERVAKATLGALCVLSLVMLFVQAIDPRTPVKEDYRDAARYVAARAESDDLFVVSAPFTTYPVEYYYDGSARLATFPRWDRFNQGSLPETYTPDLIQKDSDGWARVYRDVYMLFGYDQGYQEDVRLYMDTHFQRVDMKTFSPGLSLYVYRLRYL